MLLKKIYKVLYWKTFKWATDFRKRIIDVICKLSSNKKEMRYFQMNMYRVIENRRSFKNNELCEFKNLPETLAQSSKRKSIKDYKNAWKRHGVVPEEYYALKFQTLSEEERKKQVTRWRQFHIVSSLNNDPVANDLIENKSSFNRLFRNYRAIQSVDQNDSFEQLQELVQKNEKLILKPQDGMSGMGIQVVMCKELTDEVLQNMYQNIKKGEILVEEVLEQKGILQDINRTSVNTVRIATVRNGEDVWIPFAWVRTGRSGSVVDNLHAGGILWPVSEKDGVVVQSGYDVDGHEFDIHPDTKVLVKGMKLPRWEEAIRIVKEASAIVPKCRFISWDVAISDDDITLIEANVSGGFWRIADPTRDMWKEFREYMDTTLGTNRPMKYY